jgi:hypothetical protein
MAVQEVAQQFFNGDSVAALSGSSAFVWMVVNGIRVFIGFYRKWLFLLLSFAVVISFHSTSSLSLDMGQILLVIGNTFLLAFTAAGAQETLVHAASSVEGEEHGRRQYRGFESWFQVQSRGRMQG